MMIQFVFGSDFDDDLSSMITVLIHAEETFDARFLKTSKFNIANVVLGMQKGFMQRLAAQQKDGFETSEANIDLNG